MWMSIPDASPIIRHWFQVHVACHWMEKETIMLNLLFFIMHGQVKK